MTILNVYAFGSIDGDNVDIAWFGASKEGMWSNVEPLECEHQENES